MYHLIFTSMELGLLFYLPIVLLLPLCLLFCRDVLTVQFLVSRDLLAMLPDEKLRQGKTINVVPIIFTQGINEKQTLANLKHE